MSTEIIVNNDIVTINVTEETCIIEAPSGAYPLPTGVYSVYGRTGNVVAQDGDYTLNLLGDVTITTPSNGQVLRYNGTSWVNSTESYVGTVTSVNMTVPTGLTISGNPITTAGTLTVGLGAGYVIPTQSALDAKQDDLNGSGIVKSTAGVISYLTDNTANWDSAYNDKINSAAVTGTTTKTLTLNQQDGGTITASWTDDNTDAVTSVFGRTGAVVAQSGDYNTLQVTENTNLYFTNQRARFAISGDLASGVVYQNTTGIIALDDIPNTSLLNPSVSLNGYTLNLGGSLSLTTSDIAEGTNLYYTQARFNTAFSNKTTSDLAEGTNLYFTNTRVHDAVSANAPLSETGGVFSISQSGASTDGYLSSADWVAFNAKQAALTFTSPLVNISGTVSIPAATSSVNGYLNSTDWAIFNNKQNYLGGTGLVRSTAGVISYDTNTYLTTIEGITAGGELSGTYASPSLVNSAVTGKVLTGVNITGGSISATDSILTAFGKVQNQINGLIGGSIYQGIWNASTNTPTLTSGVGTKGYYYIVSVAGSTNLDGITDWNVGDWAIYDGTAWQQVDNTDAVVSVNGFTGAVSLTTSNINEGTNLYYTDVRARNSVSAGSGISYNSTTGIITNSNPDQVVSLTGAGTTSISGSYPSFTISSADQFVGTVTSVGITESSAALTITGSPVTTSGNINIGFAGNNTQYVAGDGSLITFPTATTTAEEIIAEVYNNTGETLPKGTIVYINGGQGNLPTVTKSIANSDSTSATTFGIIQTDLTNMNNGFVIITGKLYDLDTQAYANGTQLYLSGTTAGAWTSTKPYAPLHLVYVGVVTRSHPTQGVVEVRIQNGYELDELHNVSAQSPSNGDILQYVSSTSLWTKTAGTTTNIAEGTNLYFTNARSRTAISLTTTGSSGASTYDNSTGILNVPTYTLAGLGGINLTSLSATSPLLYNNTTGVFSIQQSSGSQAGFLSAADWTTFNNKASTAQLANYLPLTGGTLTGALSGTSATFSGNVSTTGSGYFVTSTSLAMQLNGSVANDFQLNGGGPLRVVNQAYNAVLLNITNTGAATFSSSVTANSTISAYYGNITSGNAPATSGTTPVNPMLNLTNNRGVGMYFGGSYSGTYAQWIQVSDVGNLSVNYPLSLQPNGGNVGIGTPTPSDKLQVLGSLRWGGATNNIVSSNDSGGVYMELAGTTTATRVLRIQGINDAANRYTSIRLEAGAEQIVFATADTERMRITSGGSVGIGSTGYSNFRLQITGATSDSTTYALGVANSNVQDLFYVRNDGLAGFGTRTSAPYNYNVTFNPRTAGLGQGGDFGYITSTRESKGNIETINNIDFVKQLNPVSFNYRKKDSDRKEFIDELYDDVYYGFIADEVEALDKNLVFYDDLQDGTKKLSGVHYNSMIAILTKAVQNQQVQIQELNAKIEELRKV